MKIYLAARFARQKELRKYRNDLAAMGHEVTASWLDEATPDGDGTELLHAGDHPAVEPPVAAAAREIAKRDLGELRAADCLIAFTDPPGIGPMRGTHHAEFGIALGTILCRATAGRDAVIRRVRLVVVGHRENVFHCLDCVAFFATWEEARQHLARLV